MSCGENIICHMNPTSSTELKKETSFINPLHNHENYIKFSPSYVLQKQSHGNGCNGNIDSKYFGSKQDSALPISEIYNSNNKNKTIMIHSTNEPRNETTSGMERTTILPAF